MATQNTIGTEAASARLTGINRKAFESIQETLGKHWALRESSGWRKWENELSYWQPDGRFQYQRGKDNRGNVYWRSLTCGGGGAVPKDLSDALELLYGRLRMSKLCFGYVFEAH